MNAEHLLDFAIANPGQVKTLDKFNTKDKRTFLKYARFSNYDILNKQDFEFYIKHNVHLNFNEAYVQHSLLNGMFHTNKKYVKQISLIYVKNYEPTNKSVFFDALCYCADLIGYKEAFDIAMSKYNISKYIFWEQFLNCDVDNKLKYLIEFYKVTPYSNYVANIFQTMIPQAIFDYKGDKLNDYNIIYSQLKQPVECTLTIEILQSFHLTEEQEFDLIKRFNEKFAVSTLEELLKNMQHNKNKKYLEKFLFIKKLS